MAQDNRYKSQSGLDRSKYGEDPTLLSITSRTSDPITASSQVDCVVYMIYDSWRLPSAREEPSILSAKTRKTDRGKTVLLDERAQLTRIKTWRRNRCGVCTGVISIPDIYADARLASDGSWIETSFAAQGGDERQLSHSLALTSLVLPRLTCLGHRSYISSCARRPYFRGFTYL